MKEPDFESIKHINVLGHEYWSARDLQKALGYEASWQNFEKVIRAAMTAATSPDVGLQMEEHFNEVVKLSRTGQGGQRKTRDYFLSRRACYLVAQNGDSKKPQIALAMNFFAFAAEVYDELTRLRLEQEKRLKLRLKVADENSNLSSTALQSGVKSENMSLFHDAGYHGMYTMTSHQLAVFWNVPQGVEILDIMGPEALAANLFRITATDEKLKRDRVKNESVAIATHHDVGASVRKAIEEIHEQKPEDLPHAENIRKLVEAERRKEKKRIKSKPPDIQATLF